MDYQIVAKEIYEDYEKHRAYLSNKNLINVCKESVQFYEGNHYANKKFENVELPKVSFNEIKMIIDNKSSNILSTPFSVKFSSNANIDLVDKMNRFDKSIIKDLDHIILYRQLVNDGLIKGTFAIHYYWSEDTIGQLGLYKGSLQVEVLDPLKVAISNPRQKDIQKQKWIIVPSRLEVKAVKKMCDSDIDKDLIKHDDLDTDYYDDIELEQESNDCGYVTVYTRYFRIDGEVYFERSTKDTVICKPRAFNPRLHEKTAKYVESENGENVDMDSNGGTVNDENLDEYKDYNEKFYLYPIELNSLTPSNDSIYGLSDTYSLIMPQKMLNIYFATIYKKSMDDVFPKWLVKKGALQQEITGLPNEQIVDYSNVNGWGVQKVDGASYSNGQFALGETITEFMKMVSNSRDVLQGDNIGANMSALAIQSLQTQAEKPIAQQRELFMQSLIRMARIRIMFYKFFYEEKDFSYEMDDIEYENIVEKNGFSENGINKTVNSTFRGEEYMNVNFSISVDVGRGTKYDAITAQETINNLFLNGTISNMSADLLEQYYNLLDDNLFPQKDKLKSIIRKQRQSETAMLTQQNEQLTQQLQQSQLELEQAKAYIQSLQNEFTQKINVSNERLKNAETNYKTANDTIMNLYANLTSNNTNK